MTASIKKLKQRLKRLSVMPPEIGEADHMRLLILSLPPADRWPPKNHER